MPHAYFYANLLEHVLGKVTVLYGAFQVLEVTFMFLDTTLNETVFWMFWWRSSHPSEVPSTALSSSSVGMSSTVSSTPRCWRSYQLEKMAEITETYLVWPLEIRKTVKYVAKRSSNIFQNYGKPPPPNMNMNISVSSLSFQLTVLICYFFLITKVLYLFFLNPLIPDKRGGGGGLVKIAA